MVVERSYGIKDAEAVAAAGRLLGFKNVTNSVRDSIDPVVVDLIRRGELVVDGDQLSMP